MRFRPILRESSVFFFFWELVTIKVFEIFRHICSVCQTDQFTIDQNVLCQKCVDGGHCVNGILFNDPGLLEFLKSLFNFI